ncbi:MAG: DUF1566 domain-containing protein [bacterium]|nr:DUF1566 domain-containing protein [bacterium]
MTGDDGDLQKGVATSPRFTDNGDQTVTDNLTGLMWAKDANLNTVRMNWANAITFANNLTLGSDGSGASYTDWRLPNANELASLIDRSNSKPALPTGHPFTNVQCTNAETGFYWSSTTYAWNETIAWMVSMEFGDVYYYSNYVAYSVWPVRSDN